MRGLYKHKKGGEYEAICVVLDDDNKEYVLYRTMYGDKSFWIRPIEMFLEEGRFTKISDEITYNDRPEGKVATHSETEVSYKVYKLDRKIRVKKMPEVSYDGMSEYVIHDMWEKEERSFSWGGRN